VAPVGPAEVTSIVPAPGQVWIVPPFAPAQSKHPAGIVTVRTEVQSGATT
jgi:hypothetical protein